MLQPGARLEVLLAHTRGYVLTAAEAVVGLFNGEEKESGTRRLVLAACAQRPGEKAGPAWKSPQALFAAAVKQELERGQPPLEVRVATAEWASGEACPSFPEVQPLTGADRVVAMPFIVGHDGDVLLNRHDGDVLLNLQALGLGRRRALSGRGRPLRHQGGPPAGGGVRPPARGGAVGVGGAAPGRPC